MSYTVGLVGESNFQPAILRSRPGDRIHVLHEIGNPYDELALVVKTEGGETLGYIARDCWLRDAIHYEDKGCEGIIFSIHPGELAAGVVLNIEINFEGVGECMYHR